MWNFHIEVIDIAFEVPSFSGKISISFNSSWVFSLVWLIRGPQKSFFVGSFSLFPDLIPFFLFKLTEISSSYTQSWKLQASPQWKMLLRSHNRGSEMETLCFCSGPSAHKSGPTVVWNLKIFNKLFQKQCYIGISRSVLLHLVFLLLICSKTLTMIYFFRALSAKGHILSPCAAGFLWGWQEVAKQVFNKC